MVQHSPLDGTFSEKTKRMNQTRRPRPTEIQ